MGGTRGGKNNCIKGESNPRRVEAALACGNDPGYHYPINALDKFPVSPGHSQLCCLRKCERSKHDGAKQKI